MSERSTIEWTDATWNPVSGCTKISPGCANCYAERMAERLPDTHARPGLRIPGVVPRIVEVDQRPKFSQVLTHEGDLLTPLRWRKSRRVFVCSMGDLFHPDVPFEFVDRVWATMVLSRRHTYMVLTKRPDRMKAYLCDYVWHRRDRAIRFGPQETIRTHCDDPTWYDVVQELLDGGEPGPLGRNWAACHDSAGQIAEWSPLANVWLGVSAENQAEADERIPSLLQCPAAVRFVSCEPLLGLVDLSAVFLENACGCIDRYDIDHCPHCGNTGRLNLIDWVIAGGESGPAARPAHPDWFRSLRDQCAAAGVPFFFKQWGEWAPLEDHFRKSDATALAPPSSPVCLVKRDGKVIRPYCHLDAPGAQMVRVGKRRAGRLLDGVEHNGMPGAAREQVSRRE